MFRALLGLSLWVLVGLASHQPIVDKTQNACLPAPPVAAHVLLWPISAAFTWNLQSRC